MLHIKVSAKEDIQTILGLAGAIWEPTYDPILPPGQAKYMLDVIYTEEKLREQISTNSQTYLLLYDDEQAMGFAAYGPRVENPNVYKLYKLYCLPAKQGKGYGKALIEAVENAVKEANKNILELNVNRYNKAINFYEKMGYEKVYDEDIPIGPYVMNDHVMRKML